MLAVTHLIVSLLLIQILTLDKNDAFVALVFGVFIDFDHLLGLKDYVAVHGASGVFDLDSLMQADGQWKSMFHNPVAVMIVGPVSTASRLALPLLFWGVHIAMDHVEDSFLGVFSSWEMLLLAGASLLLVSLSFKRALMSEPGLSLTAFLARQVSVLASPFHRLSRAASGLLGR